MDAVGIEPSYSDFLDDDEYRTTKLTPEDSMWFSSDSPFNKMVVNSMMIFEGRLELEAIRKEIASKLLPVARFRSVVFESKDKKSVYWKEDEFFDIRMHVTRMALPAPGSDEQLRELLNDIVRSPLDMTRPLWKHTLVEGYKNDKSVLLFRFHHALGDGTSFMRLVFNCSAQVIDPTKTMGETKVKGGVLYRLTNTIFHPEKAYSTVTHMTSNLLKATGGAVKTFERLAFLKPNINPFKPSKLSPIKYVTWSNEYSLEKTKVIRERLKVTINDIFLGAIAGGIRKYWKTIQPDEVIADDFRIGVPINIQKPDDEEFGNHFALVLLDLPVHIDDCKERLFETKRRMDFIKHSNQPVLAIEIIRAISSLPSTMGQWIRDYFTQNITGLFSNVAGPRTAVSFCGNEVKDMLFWVPTTGVNGFNVSLMSYNGKARIGLYVDEVVVKDPDAVLGLIEESFQEIECLS